MLSYLEGVDAEEALHARSRYCAEWCIKQRIHQDTLVERAATVIKDEVI